MAHNLQNRDIQVGVEQAWHNQTVIDENIKLDETMKIAYPMECRPLVYMVNDLPVETAYKQVVAMDDGFAVGNPVGEGYSLINNRKVIEMVYEALSGVSYQVVSYGTVADRSKVFISIKFDQDSTIISAGRETNNLLNIMFGHGGTMGLTAKSGFTVVVCQNTLNVALKEKGDFTFKVKHTKNAHNRLEGMNTAIDAHFGVVAEFNKAMNSLHSVACKPIQAERIVTAMLVDEADKEVSTRTSNTISRITQLYRGGMGNKGETIADLFNGITDFYTHESSGGDNTWKQMVSSEFGSGDTKKREAFTLLSNFGSRQSLERKGEKILASLVG